MNDWLAVVGRIAKRAHRHHEPARPPVEDEHPFDVRNILPDFPGDVRRLFDNGHYSQATFEAFKYLERVVQRHAKLSKSGRQLMMTAFNEAAPLIQLTPLNDITDRDEQEGFKFIFAGGTIAIRNPRAHDPSIRDDLDTCLDHLSFVSMLLRRLMRAGFMPTPLARKAGPVHRGQQVAS